MRLWHKDLIPYLPKQQLIGQWRELNSIYRLQNRHILINFVYDNYSTDHLRWYSLEIIGEMAVRGYKINTDNYNEYFNGRMSNKITHSEIYKDKMNDRYLKQCLFNLQEKHDCGGITDEEWENITSHFDID